MNPLWQFGTRTLRRVSRSRHSCIVFKFPTFIAFFLMILDTGFIVLIYLLDKHYKQSDILIY